MAARAKSSAVYVDVAVGTVGDAGAAGTGADCAGIPVAGVEAGAGLVGTAPVCSGTPAVGAGFCTGVVGAVCCIGATGAEFTVCEPPVSDFSIFTVSVNCFISANDFKCNGNLHVSRPPKYF